MTRDGRQSGGDQTPSEAVPEKRFEFDESMEHQWSELDLTSDVRADVTARIAPCVTAGCWEGTLWPWSSSNGGVDWHVPPRKSIESCRGVRATLAVSNLRGLGSANSASED